MISRYRDENGYFYHLCQLINKLGPGKYIHANDFDYIVKRYLRYMKNKGIVTRIPSNPKRVLIYRVEKTVSEKYNSDNIKFKDFIVD